MVAAATAVMMVVTTVVVVVVVVVIFCGGGGGGAGAHRRCSSERKQNVACLGEVRDGLDGIVGRCRMNRQRPVVRRQPRVRPAVAQHPCAVDVALRRRVVKGVVPAELGPPLGVARAALQEQPHDVGVAPPRGGLRVYEGGERATVREREIEATTRTRSVSGRVCISGAPQVPCHIYHQRGEAVVRHGGVDSRAALERHLDSAAVACADRGEEHRQRGLVCVVLLVLGHGHECRRSAAVGEGGPARDHHRLPPPRLGPFAPSLEKGRRRRGHGGGGLPPRR